MNSRDDDAFAQMDADTVAAEKALRSKKSHTLEELGTWAKEWMPKCGYKRLGMILFAISRNQTYSQFAEERKRRKAARREAD